MDRVILLAIAAVVISLLFGQILKGGLGLLRIISIALVFFLLVLLSARPSDSPGILPSLAKRIWAENSVQIAAEATGEILTDNEASSRGTSSPNSDVNPSFSTQANLPSSSVSRSAEAAFSGATTTASSNQIETQQSPSTVSTQSTTLETGQTEPFSPKVSSSDVQSPSSTYTPPSSASRPINALW